METLSKFDLRDYEEIEETLKSVRHADVFLNAEPVTLSEGVAVRFGWPDWPEWLRQQLQARVDALHQRVPLLRPIAEGAIEWAVAFQAWKSDPESAKEIGEAFIDVFPGRVRWVFSRRDNRGRISATCAVEKLGNVSLDLSWRGVSAIPAGQASADDMMGMSGAVLKLKEWAGRKINTILEQLQERLVNLYGDRFRGLYVFGSYAKPDAGIRLPDDSDLDVAVLLTDMESSYKEIRATSDITADLSLEHGLVISLVHLREADFRERKTNFTRVIAEYAIPVE